MNAKEAESRVHENDVDRMAFNVSNAWEEDVGCMKDSMIKGEKLTNSGHLSEAAILDNASLAEVCTWG